MEMSKRQWTELFLSYGVGNEKKSAEYLLSTIDFPLPQT